TVSTRQQSPSGERDRLRECKKRNYQDVDTQVEHGRDLMNLNATQRYYAEFWPASIDITHQPISPIAIVLARQPYLSADVAVLLEILKNQSGGYDGSTTLEKSERRNENLLSLGNYRSNHVNRRDDLTRSEFRMKICDENYKAAQRDSHNELTDVRRTSFNTQIKGQPLAHPRYEATIAENKRSQEQMKLREHRVNQRLRAGCLMPQPPISSAVSSSLGHPLIISVAEVGSSDRPIAIDVSEDEENNVGDNDHRTDPNPRVPVKPPSSAQDPIQPPNCCDFDSSNSTLRARNFHGMSQKQKKNKRRLQDRKRKEEEDIAAQLEIEAGRLMEGPPLNKGVIAGSEDIPNSIENLTPAIPTSELVMAPPASHVNATLGIERKDKAYERVITRLCFAHIDANIYIKEIAKDTEDQSTAEKLTKLCDQMTTAKNIALRNLRGHPDALERVMDSLRGKTT
ncbi:MAG: hypothetical protein Q9180_006376, partial [Flavoplaca navasiana]